MVHVCPPCALHFSSCGTSLLLCFCCPFLNIGKLNAQKPKHKTVSCTQIKAAPLNSFTRTKFEVPSFCIPNYFLQFELHIPKLVGFRIVSDQINFFRFLSCHLSSVNLTKHRNLQSFCAHLINIIFRPIAGCRQCRRNGRPISRCCTRTNSPGTGTGRRCWTTSNLLCQTMMPACRVQR